MEQLNYIAENLQHHQYDHLGQFSSQEYGLGLRQQAFCNFHLPSIFEHDLALASQCLLPLSPVLTPGIIKMRSL